MLLRQQKIQIGWPPYVIPTCIISERDEHMGAVFHLRVAALLLSVRLRPSSLAWTTSDISWSLATAVTVAPTLTATAVIGNR
jgi:hypothetical protein